MEKIRREAVELMAPAGDHASLLAAAEGGADSVYFGVKQLNMRARSSNNFRLEELPQVVALAREHGMRAYLTLNTVLYDQELHIMRRILDAAADAGVDAVILTDQAALQYARKKGLSIHLSTQLNISNTESLKFYAGYADVVVLARELNLKQVRRIARNIREEDIRGPSGDPVRIELFAHGALCMAISGKCYLSLHEYNASANRGTCLQTCRRSYIVTDKETGYELEIDNEYIMSPKDLATIDFLDQILEAGVSVLKIEGRARPPEYVYTVTKVYDEALRALEKGEYTRDQIKVWKERLATVFNRGFWDGYYLGRKLGEWSDRFGSHATWRKSYAGKGINYFAKPGVAEFLLEAEEIHVGDEILITGPTTGVIETTVQELRVEGRPVQVARKGERCSIPVEKKVRRSDKLFRLEKTEE